MLTNYAAANSVKDGIADSVETSALYEFCQKFVVNDLYSTNIVFSELANALSAENPGEEIVAHSELMKKYVLKNLSYYESVYMAIWLCHKVVDFNKFVSCIKNL